MKSYLHNKWIAAPAGLVAVLVAGIGFAGSAGATKVCPAGIKPPSPYCTNVTPVAFTGIATKVKSTRAELNGHAGPAVRFGDPTYYFFRYGKTMRYGHRTRTRKVRRGPKTAHVLIKVKGLSPNTTYHFRIFVHNADGRAVGIDRTFKTKGR